MTFDDVLALATAGFTADEIRKMSETKKPAETPKFKKPAETPKFEKPSETDESQKSDFDAKAAYDSLSKDIASLTKLVQESNLLSASNPAPVEDDVDSILASIIRPTYRKDEKK